MFKTSKSATSNQHQLKYCPRFFLEKPTTTIILSLLFTSLIQFSITPEMAFGGTGMRGRAKSLPAKHPILQYPSREELLKYTPDDLEAFRKRTKAEEERLPHEQKKDAMKARLAAVSIQNERAKTITASSSSGSPPTTPPSTPASTSNPSGRGDLFNRLGAGNPPNPTALLPDPQAGNSRAKTSPQRATENTPAAAAAAAASKGSPASGADHLEPKPAAAVASKVSPGLGRGNAGPLYGDAEHDLTVRDRINMRNKAAASGSVKSTPSSSSTTSTSPPAKTVAPPPPTSPPPPKRADSTASPPTSPPASNAEFKGDKGNWYQRAKEAIGIKPSDDDRKAQAKYNLERVDAKQAELNVRRTADETRAAELRKQKDEIGGLQGEKKQRENQKQFAKASELDEQIKTKQNALAAAEKDHQKQVKETTNREEDLRKYKADRGFDPNASLSEREKKLGLAGGDTTKTKEESRKAYDLQIKENEATRKETAAKTEADKKIRRG